MSQETTVAKNLNIRKCGLDEYWLQDQIFKQPSILGLGDLVVVSKEKRQSSGGRLDLLLKNPEDDSMFEVEVMLGATDETHIIRTIEYWDIEKRRWPQRQHFAVLVAESITRRFFNVISLLSLSIPIMAIQVHMVEINGQRGLHFSKVLDLYEEPEEETAGANYDENFWQTQAPATLEHAQALKEIVDEVYEEASLRFVKSYISISLDGNLHFWLYQRKDNKSLLCFYAKEDVVEKVEALINEEEIGYNVRNGEFRIKVDIHRIQKNKDLLKNIALIVKESWERQKGSD